MPHTVESDCQTHPLFIIIVLDVPVQNVLITKTIVVYHFVNTVIVVVVVERHNSALTLTSCKCIKVVVAFQFYIVKKH